MFTRRLTTVMAALAVTTSCTDTRPSSPTAPELPSFAVTSCALGVTQEEALALIADLLTQVDALEASGALNAGQANALRNHLNTAAGHILAGRMCAALAAMGAFEGQVGNFVDDGILTPEEAEPLVDQSTIVVEGFPPAPFRVTVDAPSSAAGVYDAQGAEFGPELTEAGVSGAFALGLGATTGSIGCDALVGFPAGAIAVVDRGTCTFVDKAKNAQAAGAVALVVVNHSFVPGAVPMGGEDPTITIPTVSIAYVDGVVLKAGLPAAGKVSRTPVP